MKKTTVIVIFIFSLCVSCHRETHHEKAINITPQVKTSNQENYQNDMHLHYTGHEQQRLNAIYFEFLNCALKSKERIEELRGEQYAIKHKGPSVVCYDKTCPEANQTGYLGEVEQYVDTIKMNNTDWIPLAQY